MKVLGINRSLNFVRKNSLADVQDGDASPVDRDIFNMQSIKFYMHGFIFNMHGVIFNMHSFISNMHRIIFNMQGIIFNRQYIKSTVKTFLTSV